MVPYKIYPSGSGFKIGNDHITDYNSGCFRYLAITKNMIRKTLDPKYEVLGKVHEAHHKDRLISQGLFEAEEIPVRVDLGEAVLSGRCDFLTVNGGIDETKASISKSFQYQVINKGNYKIGHLAQLVAYLVHFNRQHGRIICGFYTETDNGFVLKKERIFEVSFDTTGRILVDGHFSGYHAKDQHAHSLMAAKVVASGEIVGRPMNYFEFTGPCHFCPLKNLCKEYDRGNITQGALTDEALTLLKGDSNGNTKV